MMKRLLTVRTGRHPYEIAVLVGVIAVGIAGLFIDPSDAVRTVMGPALSTFFYASWAAAAAVTLGGIFHRKRIDGMLIERIGCWGLVLYFAIYAVSVIAERNQGGIATAALTGGLAVAAAVRARQIRQDIVLLTSYLADHPDDKNFDGR